MRLFSYFAAWHFVFMYYFHEGPKMDAQYSESVQAPKQLKGVLFGTFHQKFLNGAEFLLRTPPHSARWDIPHIFGIWWLLFAFRRVRHGPYTESAASSPHSEIQFLLESTFDITFTSTYEFFQVFLSFRFFNYDGVFLFNFLVSWPILLKLEIKDLHVMPSSHCKFHEQERHSLLMSINKIFDHSFYTYRTI